MKFLLASVTLFAVQALSDLLEQMNGWVELGIKVAGLAAALGGAWRWLIGPGYRAGRKWVVWVREQLELIGTLDTRLQEMDERLDAGHEHFGRIDRTLETLASEEARAIRRSMRTGLPVEFSESGQVERREPPV